MCCGGTPETGAEQAGVHGVALSRLSGRSSHAYQVSLVDHVLHQADGSRVDHLAVIDHCAKPLSLGFAIGLRHRTRRIDGGLRRRKCPYRMLYLRWMNRPFAHHADQLRTSTFLTVGCGVFEVAEGTVDRVYARCSGCDRDLLPTVVPDISGITVGPIHGTQVDPLRRRKIANPVDQRFEPRRGAGDLLHVDHRLDFFDQDLQTDTPIYPELLLELTEQRIHEENVA